MDDLTIIIIIVIGVSVLAGIGTLLFWGGLAYFGFKAVQSYQKEMDNLMQQFQGSLNSAQSQFGNNIPPEVQVQLFNQFINAQNQLRQFNDLSQQRHDLFVSDMLGQASSAGIDVSGWGSSVY